MLSLMALAAIHGSCVPEQNPLLQPFSAMPRKSKELAIHEHYAVNRSARDWEAGRSGSAREPASALAVRRSPRPRTAASRELRTTAFGLGPAAWWTTSHKSKNSHAAVKNVFPGTAIYLQNLRSFLPLGEAPTLPLASAMADAAGLRVPCEGIKRTTLYSVLTFFALWLSWSYISAFAAVGYTYLWWAAHRDLPTMPVPATDNTTVVPRIIHQTWKDRNVPEKWKAAQQSCIDHNKDFTYRLWTDEEGLRFIEVGRVGGWGHGGMGAGQGPPAGMHAWFDAGLHRVYVRRRWAAAAGHVDVPAPVLWEFRSGRERRRVSPFIFPGLAGQGSCLSLTTRARNRACPVALSGPGCETAGPRPGPHHPAVAWGTQSTHPHPPA